MWIWKCIVILLGDLKSISIQTISVFFASKTWYPGKYIQENSGCV